MNRIAPAVCAACALVLTSPLAAAPGDTVIMILVDGVAHSTAADLMRQGKLPALRELLRSKEGRLLRAISTFPSATAPSVPELLVGRYSDRASPRMLRRVQGFDRTTGRIARYEFVRQAWDSPDDDLFDLVARSGRRSFSYFEGEFRSASVNEFNPLGHGIDWATGYASLPMTNFDQRLLDDAIRDLRAERPPPALVFIALNAADIAGHSRGPAHPDVATVLIHNDRQIGKLVGALRKLDHPAGGTVFEHTHFYIFSDHGMAATGFNLTLGRDLQQHGLAVADGSDVGAMLQASLFKDWHNNVDGIVLGIGSNVAEMQVRRRLPDGARRPWHERPTLAELRALPVTQPGGPADKVVGTMDLIAYLQSHVGMDMVMVQERPGRVQLFAPGGGEALVARAGKPEEARRFAYQVWRTDADGGDPLGYLAVPGARALVTPAAATELQFFDERTWWEATNACERPYAPPLIPKAFDSGPTAPDVILVAKNGYGFLPVVKADHGNLSTESSSGFLIAAGPEFEPPAAGRGKRPAREDHGPVRLIDVNAEIRRYLGLPEDPLADSRGLGRGAASRPAP
ncbi:MAG: alkaline phosphatase family protein [Deltaproteobacteria bacterium]|nr:alkaline phosphatase family protein [Deltaproteobacteria bacterium]